MGPTSVLELLKGELVDIVDYAVDCQKKTGRPPRLAVNASSWWYANMTAATAQSVRDRLGVHANPIECSILFYILRILQLGIQLHFIFDGPKRLNKGRKLYPGHDAPSLLYQETLTNIGIPWHQAPAEAEAECAKMEMEDVVDGVWSEDGDALAFGCQTLIKSYFEIKSSTERKEDMRKSFTHFKVYKLEELARQYPGMDREGFTLRAILNGRPSDVWELHNLGPQDVLHAAGHGLGRSLCAASGSGESLRQWATIDFAGFLKDNGSNIDVPPEFPKWEHVQDYLNPVASNREVFLDCPEPRDPFLDEKTLFSFLVEKFQWSMNQWVKYVIPLRIVRSLLATKEGEESQHDCLRLECDLKKKSLKKAKATFLLCKATSLDMSALYETTGQLETLLWILRKANFNEQRSIASYLITPPKSEQKGKNVSPASASRKPFQRLKHGAGREPFTPPSGSASNSNGEGSSRRTDRSGRQNTPPSPTPTSRKRSLLLDLGTRTSKNIQPAPKIDRRTSDQTKDGSKGKAKEILTWSRANKRTARSQVDSSSSNEEPRDKRPRLTVEELPSTPPAQITAPADAVPDFIAIDSDSGEHGEAANNMIVIDSDSDEDGYGSFPSVTDLPTLLEEAGSKVIQDDVVNSSSEDEYGSFPSSPDLRSLI